MSAAHKRNQSLLFVVAALVGMAFLLRVRGKQIRADWTPMGIAVKSLLLLMAAALVYTPYELFIKGPSAVKRAFA